MFRAFSRLFAAILALAIVLGTASQLAAAPPKSREMAQRIDKLLDKELKAQGIQSAAVAEDSEFLRRATLDLTGIIPNVADVYSYLRDGDAEKRFALIDRLLDNNRHSTHLANLWASVMLPEEDNAFQFNRDGGFRTWLREQFRANVAYDAMVRDLLTTTGNSAPGQVSPALFYTALELKPEEVAASTSRLFLGVQIQCAQCHDHPFDQWSRKDFWGYAAFFSRLQQPPNLQQVQFNGFGITDVNEGEAKIPDTDEVIPPKFLSSDGSPDEGTEQNRRQRLATWLTSAENPYFAKAAVNRVWGLLFGRGIVEPVDDLGAHNAPSHPQLLDELARYFVETNFDLKRLVQTICYTEAYARSSQPTHDTADRPELFASMATKTLTAEQLYDTLAEGMRMREAASAQQQQFNQFGGGKAAFLAKFRAPTQGRTEFQAGIPQALTLMNGSVVAGATDVSQSDVLGAIDTPFHSPQQQVEVLFLSTLSRFPRDLERERFVEYVTSGGVAGDPRQALADVLWALLNSAEFVLNH